jgi:hypothetical protein
MRLFGKLYDFDTIEHLTVISQLMTIKGINIPFWLESFVP